MHEERFILLEAAEKLDISKGTLVNWIARAGWTKLVANQRMEYDQRAHYLTGAQLEKLAKDHRRTLQEATDIDVPATEPLTRLSGVWRSRYSVPSGPEDTPIEIEQDVLISHRGEYLVLKSLPDESGSLSARFTLDGHIATGTYRSERMLEGATKKTVYHGAAQLIFDQVGRVLRGKGVGFSRDMRIKTSDWELSYIGESTEG